MLDETISRNVVDYEQLIVISVRSALNYSQKQLLFRSLSCSEDDLCQLARIKAHDVLRKFSYRSQDPPEKALKRLLFYSIRNMLLNEVAKALRQKRSGGHVQIPLMDHHLLKSTEDDAQMRDVLDILFRHPSPLVAPVLEWLLGMTESAPSIADQELRKTYALIRRTVRKYFAEDTSLFSTL